MRVGLLCADLEGQHGWARYAVNVLEALQRQGVEIVPITTRDSNGGAFPDAPRLLPNILPQDNRMQLRLLQAIPHVQAALRGCDVIHTTVETFAPLAFAVAGKRPLIITGHGTYVNLPRMRRGIVGKLYARAFLSGRMVCVSHYTERVAKEVLPTLRTHVIPNAVDAKHFRPDSPVEKTGILVVTSGGVKPRKGTLELVHAMAVVRDQIPNVRCVVVGRAPEDNYGQQVRDEIERLNLQDTVELTGFISEEVLLDIYARADVFVLPSLNHGYHFEGFGLVHLEASAAAVPVIGTYDCGVEEAVDDTVTGLLIEQNHLADQLPHAILRLLTDKTLARQMGNAGKLKARRTTWDDVARQLMTVYELPR
jgi:glycosyltransferase involved in cell wall biosynthesis